jgi:class 3 adenylate cyclase/CHASE2 domain-containing sensor protein
MRWRDLAAAGLIALAVSSGVAAWALPWLAGWSLDVTFWLRHVTFGLRHDPARSPSVVVAIDEETHRGAAAREVFGIRPEAAWTPEVAQVLNRLREAGAAVVGFDMVFSASVRDFDRSYDRDFLVALQRLAREGRVVLGRLQFGTGPINPLNEQNIAVRLGSENNVRGLNLFSDPDDVVRRVPLALEVEEPGGGSRTELSMSMTLASRMARTTAERLPDGRMTFNDRVIAGSETNTLLLNFEGGSRDIPTFSFLDLVRCAQAGNEAFFREHFAGRVVFLGPVLDVEDRKLTSKRMMTGLEVERVGERCAGPPPPGFYFDDLVRREIPGVYVHATAVNNLLRGDELRELARPWQWLALLVAAAGAAVLTVAAPLALAFGALAAAVIGWTGATTAALQYGLVVPLFAPQLAALLAFALALAYRFWIADRDKRFLRRSFALYLAPAVVDRLVDSDRPPELGGEERQATFFFSDLAGFTTISEQLSAGDLVSLLNTYLTAMTDIIEAHGGFVDKYIGDAIAAVFGAPLDDPDHALNAVKAALACEAKLAELNATEPAFRAHHVAQRIGINTGPALVGNIGSRRRFNYTVMGDAVNVAARLEGVNKVYGTRILVAETTAAAIGSRILFREIDRVRVVGRGNALAIFEPLAVGAGEAADRDRAVAQEHALAAWRRRDFAAAAALFDAVAGDAVAERFAKRARALVAAPPPADWEPVTNLETK